MSQTETLLLVILGFSLAALLFLFIGRFVWSLAVRVGARRMQKQVPSTLAGLHTERDRLRAEYAKISQKLGASLETAKAQMAEQMAEVNRTRNRIGQLVVEVNAKDQELAARQAEIATLKGQISALESNASATESDVTMLRAEGERQSLEIASLKSELAMRDMKLAELTPAPAIVPDEVTQPSDPDIADAEARLKRRIEALSNLSQQIEQSRAQPTAEEPLSDPSLQTKLEEAARETEDLQKELARLDAGLGRQARRDRSR